MSKIFKATFFGKNLLSVYSFVSLECVYGAKGGLEVPQKEDPLYIKEVFSEKSCFNNFAHPLSEGENIKK